MNYQKQLEIFMESLYNYNRQKFDFSKQCSVNLLTTIVKILQNGGLQNE